MRRVWIARILIRHHIASNTGGGISYKTPRSLFTLAVSKGQFVSAVRNDMMLRFKRDKLKSGYLDECRNYQSKKG